MKKHVLHFIKIILFLAFLIFVVWAVTRGSSVKPITQLTIPSYTIYLNGNNAIPDSVMIIVRYNGAIVYSAWFNSGDAEATADSGELVFTDQLQDIDGAGGDGYYLITARAYDKDSTLYTNWHYSYEIGLVGDVDNIVLYTDGDGSDGIDADINTIMGYLDADSSDGVDPIILQIRQIASDVKAKTDNLPDDPADDSDIDAQLLAIDNYVDTEVGAIKDKTDLLTFTTKGVEAAVKELDEDSATIDLDGTTVGTVTSVTNDVGITQAGADKAWGTITRALTDKADFTLASGEYTNIWNKDISGYSGVGYAGTYLKNLWDKKPAGNFLSDGVWTDAKAGYLDISVASRSSHSASDIWTVGTRDLTTFKWTIIDTDYDTATHNFSNTTFGTVTNVSDKTGYSLSSSQTFDLTGSITGNLSGSVGSVTGSVGSVVGQDWNQWDNAKSDTASGMGDWFADWFSAGFVWTADEQDSAMWASRIVIDSLYDAEKVTAYLGADSGWYQIAYPPDGSSNKDSARIFNASGVHKGTVIFRHSNVSSVWDSLYFYKY